MSHATHHNLSPSPLPAKVELESATTTSRLLEELRERMSTASSEASEWIAALARHRIVGIVALVEPGPFFGIAEGLVSFVNGCHLRFGAALIRVGFHDGFAAKWREGCEKR